MKEWHEIKIIGVAQAANQIVERAERLAEAPREVIPQIPQCAFLRSLEISRRFKCIRTILRMR